MAVKWPTNNVVSIFVDKTIVGVSSLYISGPRMYCMISYLFFPAKNPLGSKALEAVKMRLKTIKENHHTIFLALHKIFTKNQDSKRHLLDLSWWYGLKSIFLGIKLFCFSRQIAETFSICLKLNFVKPHKISTHLAYSDNCYYSGIFLKSRFFLISNTRKSLITYKIDTQ